MELKQGKAPIRARDCHDHRRLPCGCQVGTKVLDGTRTFVYEPCSPDCKYWQRIQAEVVEKRQKPFDVYMEGGTH